MPVDQHEYNSPDLEEEEEHGLERVSSMKKVLSFIGGNRMSAPPLQPTPVEPNRWSNATVPLGFLTRVDRIRVRDTVVRDKVTYYTMEVYLYHPNSRLPTNQVNPKRQHRRQSSASDTTDENDDREPDLKVERRFSQFAQLRDDIFRHASIDTVAGTCNYCYNIMLYLRFKLAQPRTLVKMATSVNQRKRILESFMNDIIDLAQGRVRDPQRCEGHEHVPALLQSFLED